uniref:Uncharacterized protein n=1 Tax=Plectus sambesii TaxID=2011161 RepID=A0A914X0J2_9BILA
MGRGRTCTTGRHQLIDIGTDCDIEKYVSDGVDGGRSTCNKNAIAADSNANSAPTEQVAQEVVAVRALLLGVKSMRDANDAPLTIRRHCADNCSTLRPVSAASCGKNIALNYGTPSALRRTSLPYNRRVWSDAVIHFHPTDIAAPGQPTDRTTRRRRVTRPSSRTRGAFAPPAAFYESSPREHLPLHRRRRPHAVELGHLLAGVGDCLVWRKLVPSVIVICGRTGAIRPRGRLIRSPA